VIEPEALGDGACELVLPQRALLDEDPLRQRALVLGLGDREVHRSLVDEPELDDDVAQPAAGASAP
jgi:hypothetical protein